MRIFYTDINRPRKLAKKLKNILNVSLTDSQQHIARMSGYKDWNELKVVTNRDEEHSQPDMYENPIQYFNENLKIDMDTASKLIIFFKNNLQYPKLICKLPQDVKDAIQTYNGNIIIGSDTSLPQFVYQNICDYISSIYQNNFIFKKTVTEEVEIVSDVPYTLKIHAHNLENLQQRYQQLITCPKTSLFIYIEIKDNKVVYNYQYCYFIVGNASFPLIHESQKTREELFKQALESALRSDPQVIKIGETRNSELAKILFDRANESFLRNMWSNSNADILTFKIMELVENTNPAHVEQIKIMLTALLNAMVWLRNHKEYNFTAKDVWKNIYYDSMHSIMSGQKFPELPVEYRQAIGNYFNGLQNLHETHAIDKLHGRLQHELIGTFKHFGLDE